MTDRRIVEQAHRDAARAAEAARVTVHEAGDPQGLADIATVYHRIWGTVTSGPVLQDEVLRVYALTGQYLVVATDEVTDEVLAASTGLLAAPPGRAVHSHITGVLTSGLGRGVGYAIKLHQRAWALDRGLELVTWTFDPLNRRNAWFNLTKLGARPVRYLPDFYGAMSDAINAGDASDRLYLHWPLTAPHVVRACAGEAVVPDPRAVRHTDCRVLVAVAPDGRSPEVAAAGPSGERCLVQVPPAIDTVRREDLALARQWRAAVREALLPAMTDGARIAYFTRDGHYVLEPPEPRSEEIDA